MSDDLLEREDELAQLQERLEAVRDTGAGHLQLVAGEAGIGKTALLRAFRDRHEGDLRFLWGACDPLFTPRPLGPVVDVAEQAGGELTDLATTAARAFDVARVLLRTVAAEPTALVLEDLHWADEATLDVIRLLARRVETVPTLVVASYRDDEVDAHHALRPVLGEIVRHRSVSRVKLKPLSAAGLNELVEPHRVDARELGRITGGNPFFVTEVLAAGGDQIPDTVRDAVLARADGLPHEARPLLNAIAIGPQGTELWLLEALAADEMQALDRCVASGMLTLTAERVTFRHELARLAVEGALPPPQRRELHARALDLLREREDVDPARLTHHAEAVGDPAAVLEFAPVAAERAAALGAHRQAADLYLLSLSHREGLSRRERADLEGRAAQEYFLVGEMTDAIGLARSAAAGHRAEGDLARAGAALCALIWPLWNFGRVEEAVSAGTEAASMLEAAEAYGELAQSWALLSFLAMTQGDVSATKGWGDRALELGEKVGDRSSVSLALTSVGGVEQIHGEAAGREKIERGLAIARDAGLSGEAAAAFVVLGRGLVDARAHEDATACIAEGIDYCERYDLEGHRPFLLALRGEDEFECGRWDSARDAAESVLRTGGSGAATALTLTIVGRLRGRCGDPDPWEPLDRARDLTAESSEGWRIVRVAGARAEVAWIEGRHEDAIADTQRAWDRARQIHLPWVCGELAQWRRRCGADEELPPSVAEPYALSLAGDWRGAYELWSALECPYDAALAAAEGDDEHGRIALEILHELGARATAAVVARRLRERGATGLPRGPRAATASNPAQLSARELDVLELLAEGLRNAEIADRLVISPRTVDHHVSAILRKLEIGSRGEAAAAAARLGLVPR